jgi:hypothetical protein
VRGVTRICPAIVSTKSPRLQEQRAASESLNYGHPGAKFQSENRRFQPFSAIVRNFGLTNEAANLAHEIDGEIFRQHRPALRIALESFLIARWQMLPP